VRVTHLAGGPHSCCVCMCVLHRLSQLLSELLECSGSGLYFTKPVQSAQRPARTAVRAWYIGMPLQVMFYGYGWSPNSLLGTSCRCMHCPLCRIEFSSEHVACNRELLSEMQSALIRCGNKGCSLIYSPLFNKKHQVLTPTAKP
jgi:hypothetical protein